MEHLEHFQLRRKKKKIHSEIQGKIPTFLGKTALFISTSFTEHDLNST